MIRLLYTALGAVIGGAVVAAVILSMLNTTVTEHQRFPIPLAWEGVTGNNTLGV